MRTSPSQLVLSTVIVALGVLITWSQVEAIVSWRPTVAAHLGMGLVVVGVLATILGQLGGRRRTDP